VGGRESASVVLMIPPYLICAGTRWFGLALTFAQGKSHGLASSFHVLVRAKILG